MTAQQQLVELIGDSTRRCSTWEKERLARVFIRDHGPAIAELIEAVSAYTDKPNLQMAGPMGAALRKLTQEATP